MSSRYKELMEKSLNCIHLARAINDRYEDPTKIPSEELANMKALNAEAFRLRSIAEEVKRHDDLESWAAAPDGSHPALEGKAATDAVLAQSKGGRDPVGEAGGRVATERFAKAMRHGMAALNMEEKAALVEDATGEILVPHDIAGPIFKTLPRLAVFRQVGPLIRNTTSNKVDVRSVISGTAAWGKLEVLGTGSGTAAARDASLGTTAADVIEVHDLVGLAKFGVDELQDTDANLVALTQGIVGQLFAQLEDDSFANGSGSSRPWGIAMRATQASPLITQAVTATTPGAPTGDDLKKLQFRVPARFRTNGAYIASADAAEGISLLKDSTSNYLWQATNSIQADATADTLFGKRFYVVEGLPSMAGAGTSDPSVIFGDFNAGYMVADRQQISMQRLDELFATDGQVGFLFKMRVGGDVIRPAAFAKYLL